MSTAASAREVIAPTVVALVEANRSCQTASIVRGVRADQAGQQVVAQQRQHGGAAGADRVGVAEPGHAVVVSSSTNTVSCLRNAWTASVRTVSTSRSTRYASARVIVVLGKLIGPIISCEQGRKGQVDYWQLSCAANSFCSSAVFAFRSVS